MDQRIQKIFQRYSDLELFTMLLIGEAEGEPYESKVGVALTVADRVQVARKKQFGLGWRGVMLHPHQFSCFVLRSARKRMITHWQAKDAIWQEHWQLALTAYLDLVSDFVGFPLYYVSAYPPTGVSSRHWPPSWTDKLVQLGRFGNHIFYSERALAGRALLTKKCAGSTPEARSTLQKENS